MYTKQLNVQDIALILDRLRSEGGERPHLVFPYSDNRLNWAAFNQCSDHGLPGLDKGQCSDCRWSLADGRGLHAHWYEDRVEFHIDNEDPTKNPIGHVLFDTPAGGVALAFGLLVGLATGSVAKGILAAVGGVGIGLALDSGATSRWMLDYWGFSSWQARPNAGHF